MTTKQEAVAFGTALCLPAAVRAEYLEMPGLRLTMRQAARLWNVDPGTCGIVLDALVGLRFLRKTQDGSYVRCDEP